MKNKKGLILGGFFTDFFVILFVLFLLIFSVIVSGFVKSLDDSEGGVRVEEGFNLGLISLKDYMEGDYDLVLENRVKSARGEKILGWGEGTNEK